jgi:hypothetical protein
VLTGAYGGDDSFGAPGDLVGAVGVLDIAVLEEQPPARPRLEDELRDAEVVGRPPVFEQVRLGQMTPDQVGAPGNRPLELEGSGVGPAGLVRGQSLGSKAEPVSLEGLVGATGLVGRVGEPIELGGELSQGIGSQRVDPPLTGPL